MDLLLDSEESGGASAANTRVDVYALLEYYSNTAHAGKSHLGVPRRKLGTINNSDDGESAVRKFASEPGAYFYEVRAGRDVLDSGVVLLKPRAQNIELDSSPASETTQNPVVLLLQQMNQRLERLESGSIAARPPNKARLRRGATGDIDTARSVADRPRSLSEQVDEALTVLRKVKDFEAESNTGNGTRRDNPDTEEDAESKTLLLLLKDRSVRERALNGLSSLVGGELPERSWIADVGELFAEHGDKLLPLVAMAGNALMPQTAPAMQAPPQQRAPQRQAPPREVPTPAPEATAEAAPQPPSFEAESDAVVTNMLLDMEKNRGVKSSARDIVSLIKDFPAETQMLSTLFEQPSETILQVLAGRIPSCATIVGKPESAAWLDRLKAEIKTRQQKAANVAPVVPDASETVAQAKTA